MTSYLNFINNQWVAADDGASFGVANPATEATIGQVSAASTAQALAACDAAAAAQRGWRKLTSIERAAYLHTLANALEARKGAIGQALALESGKSLEDSEGEAFYAAEITRYQGIARSINLQPQQ